MQALELKLPPPVWALICCVAAWNLAHRPPLWPAPAPTWLTLLAVLLAGVSFAFALVALLQFRRAGTTVHPHHPARTTMLVTDGVYRHTRNPMYLAMVGVMLAWALWQADLRIALAPALFVPIITRLQIFPEERALRARFGAEYEAWHQRVGRWI